MSATVKLQLKSWIGILAIILAIIVGGTWMAVKITTDHLLYQNASVAARDWAHYLAENVADLEQIALGETPSAASMTFFQSTQTTRQVFRYVVFNRDGYSQLISNRQKIAFVDHSELDTKAARSVSTGAPIVDVSEGVDVNEPSFFARAYVPILVNNSPVAVVSAYVDQTEQRNNFRNTFLVSALSLCLLTGICFIVPAVAWYRRSREKQQADRRIRFLAHHDALTGLANRATLIDRLNAALNSPRLEDSRFAVHFIDLDRFKEVNDTLGHDAGDFLLKSVADRLGATVRPQDLVARLGGDEFVVVQFNILGRDDAAAFAQRLRRVLTEPLQFNANEIVCLASIGVALAPADGNDPERLLKSADLALYKSKSEGRNCVHLFSPELDEVLLKRLKLERAIREAVLHGSFELHYQPIFGVAGRNLTGFEALIRLPAGDGTLIPPNTFIPVAEELHLIDKVGEWVLREACSAAASWPGHLTLAVNLSPAQFKGPSISRIVSDAMTSTGLEPHRLELEITEGLLLGDNATVMVELQALKAMGVSIVMDDFGTGYSSLSYLWRFPFDKIKIDRSFMQAFNGADRDAETVVKTIIALGRELNMNVTVEGVETAEQVAFLDNVDADQVQGFYFGRPVAAVEVAAEIMSDIKRNQSAACRQPVAPSVKPMPISTSANLTNDAEAFPSASERGCAGTRVAS